MRDIGLSDAVSKSLPAESKTRLEKLQTWDLSRVSRRTQARMSWSTSRRRTVEREYRRFLGLVVLNPNKAYGMAGEVDELWHDHILDTQDYLAMCRDVVGAVVHHCPMAGKLAKERRADAAAYEADTYQDLARVYKGRVSRVWPTQKGADALAKCCNHVSDEPPA